MTVASGNRDAATLLANHDHPFSWSTASPKTGSLRKLRVNTQPIAEIAAAISMAAHQRDATAIAATAQERIAVTAQNWPVETILSDTSASRSMGSRSPRGAQWRMH